jgi:hypothetical protein
VRVRRGLVLVPLVVALALLTAACGSQNVLQRNAVAAAAARTADVGSSRVAFEITATPFGRDVSVRGQGAFDYEAARGRLELDVSPLLSGARVEVRIVDSKLFVRTPATLAWVPGIKPWVAVGDRGSLDAYGLGELQQDPGQLLSLLRASSTKVTKTGTVAIRGVETTRYVAQLDLTKALEANADALGLTATEREALRRVAHELRARSARQTLPVVVFVDDKGLVRRLTLRDAKGSLSVDFWDFGADVDVQAPPARDVSDISGLLQP